LLAAVFFLLGLAVSAWWFNGLKRAPARPGPAPLPENVRTALDRLESMVEVRFYSLLDPASVPEATRNFADYVHQVLSNIEQEGESKVRVVRIDTLSDSNANAASADGIQPFNLEKGQPCFLGLVVESGGKKEALPRLSPEWEQAVESDLVRAMERVAASKSPPTTPAMASSALDPAVVEETRRALPEASSLTFEEGRAVLRERALAEFKKAATELEAQVRAAQRRLSEAQEGKSAAEQEAAMRELQQAQAAQAEKLKEIASKAEAQVEALKQMKSGAARPQPAK
jgi:hypothetical protein